MLLWLSVGTQIFLYAKLREAGVSSFARNIYMLWALLVFTAGFFGSIDFGNPYYDFMPGRLDEIFRAVAMTWAIITILAFMAVIGIDAVTLFRPFTKKKLCAAILLTIAGSIYCAGEAYFVRRRNITITTKKINTDRLRIVFLTDIHIGGLSTIRHFQRVMNIVDEAKPDILLLGGDTIDGDMAYRERELSLLAEAARKARYGAYAVNGNHEHYHFLDIDVEGIIRDCGINMLIDERTEAGGITLIGLDDRRYGWIKPYLKPEDADRFVIVLKHRPGVPFDAEGRFDLQLSGHTHGGQFWPVGYFKNMALHSTQGLSRRAGGYVYVSNGSGFNGAMMRMFTPPEVTVIDLVRE